MRLKPELQAKLTRLERLVDYEEWFIQEVEKGLAAAQRGEFVEHEDVRKQIESRYRG